MFPWFICMLSAILTSLAYCIMWWAGDVRDYWLALTILEIIGVIINVSYEFPLNAGCFDSYYSMILGIGSLLYKKFIHKI